EELFDTGAFAGSGTYLREIRIAPSQGKMFWTEVFGGTSHTLIYSANLDGSNRIRIFGTEEPGSSQDWVSINGLAVDDVNGKVYWTIRNPDRSPTLFPPEPKGWIMQSDMDGSNQVQ